MDEFREEISREIILLPTMGKILFAALTADSLYPNYVAFEKSNSWGNHEVLQDSISFIFEYTINPKLFTAQNIKDSFTRVELVTPDTNEFSGILTSFGLDACTSVLSTLQFMIDEDDQHIIDVATYARDTVDMFIQEKEDMNSLDPSIDIQIEHDDFMIKEKKRQKELISTFTTMDLEAVTDNLIKGLRNMQSIIDLSLLPLRL